MAGTWDHHEVTTEGGPFLVSEGGAGSPTVLYLHDEVSTAPSPLAEELARHHRLVAPTHPGFGEANRPAWVQSIRDVADHYQALLDELDLPSPLVLVGASMGAWIACELALRGLAGSLVLVAPIGVRVPGHPAADFWYVREREELLFRDLTRMPRVSAEEQVANEESAARYGWQPRLYDPTLGPRLHRLRMPTLLVWSSGDRLLPPEHLQAWRRLIPSAVVAEVADAGHFPGHEQPGSTAALIESFAEDVHLSTGAAR